MSQLQELERLFEEFQREAARIEAEVAADPDSSLADDSQDVEGFLQIAKLEAEVEELRDKLHLRKLANAKLQAELQQALARVTAREERMQEMSDELKRVARERDIAVNEKAKMAKRNAELQTMYTQDTSALHDELGRFEQELVKAKLGFAQVSAENDELRQKHAGLQLTMAEIKYQLATMKQLSDDRSHEVEALGMENFTLKQELQRLREAIDRSPRASVADQPTTLSWSTFFAISPTKSSPTRR